MPGTYKSTKSVTPLPAISIDMAGGVTYSEIQQSLGAFVYQISNIYITGSSIAQLVKLLELRRYDSNGNTEGFPVDVAVDPYQKQSAINIDVTGKEMVFDGRLTMSLTIAANEMIMIVFDAVTATVDDFRKNPGMFRFYDNLIENG